MMSSLELQHKTSSPKLQLHVLQLSLSMEPLHKKSSLVQLPHQSLARLHAILLLVQPLRKKWARRTNRWGRRSS